MPLGSYYVCVVERPTLGRPAFADYYLDRAHPAKVDATDPAAAPPPVKIALELGVRITGRALRLDGTPVGKALVGAEVSGFGGEIDEQGRFTILGLPVGVDQALHVAPLDRHYAYFRLLRVAGGKLKPGGTFDVGDVTFVPLPERPNFVGTLSNADGTPYRGLTTVILLDKEGTLKTGADVREGHFERRVLTGEYRITTMASEGEGLPLGTVSIKAGQVAEMDLKIPNREKGGGGKAPVAATSPSTGPTGGK